MTIIGFIVCGVINDSYLPKGNPAILTNAIDYQGNICGYSSPVKNLKYGYYLIDTSVICVSSCPTKNDYYNFVCKYSDQSKVDNSSVATGYTYVSEYKCMYKIKTRNFLNRCFPDTNVAEAYTLAKNVSGSSLTIDATYITSTDVNSGWFTSFLGDVLYLDGYIFGFGIGVATGLSFLYLYVIRFPGLLFTVIWSIVLSIFVFLLVGSFLLWSLAKSWKNDGIHEQYQYTAMVTIAYFGMALSALYFCLILVLRKRIQLAIHVVEEASRAITAMPALMFLPVLQVIGMVCFLAPWMIYLFYLASSGDVNITTTSYTNSSGATISYSYRSFTYTKNSKYVFLYLLFCFYWTSEFILACGQLVISMAISCWYFTRDKSKISSKTVLWAMKEVTLFHLGTAAFGSLIIAIIKLIRTIIAYVQKKAKQSGNKVLEYIMCCCQCFMWCLEKILKFLNKHAYIMTSMKSTSFLSSARKAFFLLLRNILRVFSVNMVANFLLLLGKMAVPIATTFLCYLAIAYGVNNANISGIISVLVFTFILAYWVSTMFSEIFGMGIESILFCFIADEEMFDLSHRFADGHLATTLQKSAQEVEKMKLSKAQIIQVLPVSSDTMVIKDSAIASPDIPVANVEVQKPGAVLL